MAVRSISRNAVEMTEDGDIWADVVRADSILAVASGSGAIELYTNILDMENVIGTTKLKADTTGDLYWTSGPLNAGQQVESAISLGDAYGLRLSCPAGGRVVIYLN